MYPTRTVCYALRLSLSQSGGTTQLYRRNSVDRGTAGSAFLLATVGLSVSMFSLKQMLSSQMPHNRLRRLH